MRLQRLRSITVENFRSISGSHTVPLDAPVVLVHGLNGAGKTSLLSAIEYGLTGELSALDAIEKGYRKQLPHLGREGSILVETEGVDLANTQRVTVPASAARVRGMLDQRLARFFSTRCYLAQSTLSQLLTVYGTDEGSLGSPLSQFAADLLGLDRLDALQLGLRPAKDVRNLRNLTPTYRSFEEKREVVTQTLETAERELRDATGRHEDSRRRLKAVLEQLGLDETVSADELDRRPADAALDQQGERERAIEAAARSSQKIEASRAPEPAAAIAEAERASQAAAGWREEHGKEVAALLADARSQLPDTPATIAADIDTALASLASQLTAASVQRRTVIIGIETAARRLAEIDDQLTRKRAAAAALERRIDTAAKQAPDLAAALAVMMPHILGDVCPVCRRDYSEIAERPLRDVVEERVGAIQRSAIAIANDTVERSRLVGEAAELERERSGLAAAQPASVERQNLDRTVSQVEALASRATNLLPTAHEGAQLLAEEVRAARQVAEQAEGEAATTLLNEELARLEALFGIADGRRAPPVSRIAALGTEPAEKVNGWASGRGSSATRES